MPKKVYNNVEDSRLICDKEIVEDVTTVVLPTIEHPTTSLQNISGMSGDIDMPNPVRVNAMELTVNHNNGINSKLLAIPGKHNIEFRIARQKFDVAKTDMQHEGVKYRMVVLHKSTEKGTVEAGNPLGSSDKYSVLRYEEIIDGKQSVLIDVPAGQVKYNGKSYSDTVQNLLK